MIAVPEVFTSPAMPADAGQLAGGAQCRRLVAITDSTMELLRPASDLLRMVTGVGQVDLLVAAVDLSVTPQAIAPLLSDPVSQSDVDRDVDPYSDVDSDDEDGAADERRAEIMAEVARLELPELQVHHLDLAPPLGPAAEDDLVAALSELVGFDPEPGVYCLAPAPLPNDVARSTIVSAAQRIARIYGLPMLRYRCLELAVVPEQREPGGH